MQCKKTTKAMKHLFTALLIAAFSVAKAQDASLTADPSLPIPKLTFDAAGELVITASATSSPNDFDFLVGKWKLKHRKIKSILTGSNEWREFETIVEDSNILEGLGNMDIGH